MRKGVVWKVVQLSAIAFHLSVAGCFTYVPVELETVPHGGHARVEMTRLGFAALPEIPGQSGPRLAGRVAGGNEEQLLLRVPIPVPLDRRQIGQEVAIPTRDILQVEIREFNRTRTGILIASGFAAVLTLYVSLERGWPFTEEEEEDQQIEDPGDPGGGFSGSPLLLRVTSPWTPVLFSIRVR